MVRNSRQMIPPSFNMNEFPFNMLGQFMQNQQGFKPQQIPPSFWDILMEPPFKNMDQTMGALNQINHQQYANWKANLGQPGQPNQQPQPPQQPFNSNQQTPFSFTDMFGKIDGWVSTAGKYYPYVKKAAPFLDNLTKML